MEHPLIRFQKENGLTQEQLAERLLMPQSQVSRLSNRKRLPTLKTIMRIEQVTGIKANDWTAWLDQTGSAA